MIRSGNSSLGEKSEKQKKKNWCSPRSCRREIRNMKLCYKEFKLKITVVGSRIFTTKRAPRE